MEGCRWGTQRWLKTPGSEDTGMDSGLRKSGNPIHAPVHGSFLLGTSSRLGSSPLFALLRSINSLFTH